MTDISKKPEAEGRSPDPGAAARAAAKAADAANVAPERLERVLEVEVELKVELGRRRLRIADVLGLGPGAVIEFSKSSDEPLDILVNDQLVARGEAVVIGERYGVRVVEVVSPNERLRTSGIVKEGVA